MLRCERKDFASEEEYHKAVSVRYKSRSAKEYISNILTHFHKEAKNGHVILRLLGVKGSISYHLHDVHLYSIDRATYLPEDSLNEIEKQCAKIEKVMDILVEINVSGEESKSGISPEEAEDFIRQVSRFFLSFTEPAVRQVQPLW